MSDGRQGPNFVRRAHSASGVLLGLIVLFHVRQAYSAFDGRAAWVASGIGAGGGGLWPGLVLALTALHGVLGLLRGRGSRGHSQGSGGLRRVQLVTGVGTLVFLAYHLWFLRGVTSSAHANPAHTYDLLWSELGTTHNVLIYVCGVTLLCYHLGYGLSRLPTSWGQGAGGKTPPAARLGAFVFGILFWLATLHVVGYFVTGDGLWPVRRLSPAEQRLGPAQGG